MPNRIGGVLRRGVLAPVVLLLAALSGAVLVAGTAWAGGPTSALLVASPSGRAAGLHLTDARYDRLGGLLTTPAGAATTAGTPDRPASVTVTWMIHDVAVWRVDRIHLDRPDGPWVLREEVESESPRPTGGPRIATGTWYRPADPAALLALLDELQLLEVSGPAGAGPGGVPGPAPAGGAAAVADGTSDGTSDGWAGRWTPVGALLGGLLVGAAGAVLALRRSAVVRRRVLGRPAVAESPSLVADRS